MRQLKMDVDQVQTLVVSADTRIQSVVAQGYRLSTNRQGQLLARLNGVNYAVRSHRPLPTATPGRQISRCY